jgi:hypothetical protein
MEYWNHGKQIITKTVLLVCISLLLIVAAHAGAEENSVTLSPAELRVVDAYIKSKEVIRSTTNVTLNRTENRDVRRYIQGDIDKDGIPDIIVLYGLEGQGNTWNVYMAVFKRLSMKFIGDARVGGKGYRGAELSKVADGAIEVKVDLYSPYDGLCCPSVKGTAYYYLGNKSVTEEKLIVDCTGWQRSERPPENKCQ